MKVTHAVFSLTVLAMLLFVSLTSMKVADVHQTKAYLEITLDIKAENRASAGGIYLKYKKPFLTQIKGATSKELLMRANDVQVLHGFETEADANAYLTSKLFEQDVVRELKPYLEGAPAVSVYSVFQN